nr:MAG TPA: hypothetical protein [Caudoviricetes sp.]
MSLPFRGKLYPLQKTARNPGKYSEPIFRERFIFITFQKKKNVSSVLVRSL